MRQYSITNEQVTAVSNLDSALLGTSGENR